jgi:hypothetical protein
MTGGWIPGLLQRLLYDGQMDPYVALRNPLDEKKSIDFVDKL